MRRGWWLITWREAWTTTESGGMVEAPAMLPYPWHAVRDVIALVWQLANDSEVTELSVRFAWRHPFDPSSDSVGRSGL